MSSYSDAFLCFGDDWPGVAAHGFEGTDSWVPLGRVPSGAGVERPFWDAVSLQETGGGRARWKANVDFYADVLTASPAYPRVQAEAGAEAEPFWFGLHPLRRPDAVVRLQRQGPPGHPAAPLRAAPRPTGVAELDAAGVSTATGGRHLL